MGKKKNTHTLLVSCFPTPNWNTARVVLNPIVSYSYLTARCVFYTIIFDFFFFFFYFHYAHPIMSLTPASRSILSADKSHRSIARSISRGRTFSCSGFIINTLLKRAERTSTISSYYLPLFIAVASITL